MMTMKGYAKNIQSSKWIGLHPDTSLLVVNELGMVVDVLVKNGDLETVATVENYFDHSKLLDDQYLIRMIKTDKATMIQEDGGNWMTIPA